MQTATKIKPKIAGKNDLYRVDYCVFRLPGTSSLTPRARRYLFFLISLVTMGYEGISAPMGAIADAIFRAQGQTAGVRTLRYALSELERAGYLARRKCRVGADRGHAVIDFCLDRFVFWTRIKQTNVIAHPTSSHISSCRQDLPADYRRINHRVNSCDSSVINIEEQRARTCSKKSAKKRNYHPIVYTLLCVIPRSPVRDRMLRLAAKEISCGHSFESGVDWGHFAHLWRALDPAPGGGRERTARREIVPLLYAAVMRSSGGDRLEGEGGDNRIGVSVSPPPVDLVEFENRYIPDFRPAAQRSSSSRPPGGGNSIKTALCKMRLEHKLKNVKSGITKQVGNGDRRVGKNSDITALNKHELEILMRAKLKTIKTNSCD